MRSIVFPFLCVVCLVPASADADVIKFEPTQGVQTFAVRPPVLRIKPGDTVESRTFSKPGDYYEKDGGAWPGEVGPFYIEGAAPGDALVVRIIKVRPNRDSAVSNVRPNGISAVAPDNRTRMITDPLPARRFVWALDRDAQHGHPGAPQLGVEANRGCLESHAGAPRGRTSG